MDREGVLKEIISLKEKSLLLQLPTSFGKTRCAIELLKSRNIKGKVLIVVPRLVLIQNWKDELKKWEYSDEKITFSTYVSLSKNVGNWDAVIYDECHHLSDRCVESLPHIKSNLSILLSATVKKNLKSILKILFMPLKCYEISAREAIDNEVLPDPEVHLIPLQIDKYKKDCQIVFNPKCETTIYGTINQKWQLQKIKDKKVIIKCTQKEWLDYYDSKIEYFKRQAQTSSRARNMWLFLCKQRLDFLSKCKTQWVKTLLQRFKDSRTLTFCSTIEQSEELGANSINSKKKDNQELIDKFNKGEINHITAVNMVNEGMNLVNCQVGIYANLNSSEIIVAQRLGRLLRHPNPIIILPFYVDTREEELKGKMLESYNKDKIHIGL